MMCITKTGEYLKVLTDHEAEVKDFVVINFSGYLKSTIEDLYSALSEKENFRKVTESLFCSDKYVNRYNFEVSNVFDPDCN